MNAKLTAKDMFDARIQAERIWDPGPPWIRMESLYRHRDGFYFILLGGPSCKLTGISEEDAAAWLAEGRKVGKMTVYGRHEIFEHWENGRLRPVEEWALDDLTIHR